MKRFKPVPRPESRELQEFNLAARDRDRAFRSKKATTGDYREAVKFADAKHAAYVESLA
jgi:hypothetical protein